MKKLASFCNKVWTSLRRVTNYGLDRVGLPAIYIGVACLAIFYFTGLTNYNLLLILPLLMILIGIIGFVHQQKTKGAY